jgi:hypothetical protein
MKSYDGFQGNGFDISTLRGASMLFNDWSDDEVARRYLLKQLATLPDQTDRDRFARRFASVLWVFDETGTLEEGPPDKSKWLDGVRKSITALRLSPEAAKAVVEMIGNTGNDEQGGSAPPATAPESKTEGKDD